MAKSLTRIIGEGVFLTSATNIGLKVIGLVTVFVMLYALGVYEYGLLKLALAVVPVMSIFFLPGSSDAIIADMGIERGRGNFGRMKALLLSYFKVRFLLGVAGWGILFFGSNVIAYFYAGDIASLLKILSFLFLLEPFRICFSILFRVYLKFFQQSLLTFFEELFKLLLILFFFFTVHIYTIGVAFATVFASLLSILIAIFFFMPIAKEFFFISASERIPMLDVIRLHRKWGILSYYTNSLGPSIRLYMIKFFAGTEAVGLYAVAAGLLAHTMSLFSLGSILGPVFPLYVDQKERFHRLIQKGIKYQLVGFGVLGTFAFFAFPPLISALFPHFASSMELFRIILIALIPLSFAAVFTQVFPALQYQKSLFFGILFKTVVILVASPLFILSFGVAGAAYEFILTTALFTMERYRRIREKIPELHLLRKSFFIVDEEDRIILRKMFKFLRI